MTSFEILKLNEQVVEAWNEHDVHNFLSLCDDGIVWQTNRGEEAFRGKIDVMEYFNNWNNAFPDLRLEIKNVIAGEDQVAVEYLFAGTNNGPFRTRSDMPEFSPTYRTVRTHGSYIARVNNGKITGVSNYPDRYSLFDQLGVLSELYHHAGI